MQYVCLSISAIVVYWRSRGLCVSCQNSEQRLKSKHQVLVYIFTHWSASYMRINIYLGCRSSYKMLHTRHLTKEDPKLFKSKLVKLFSILIKVLCMILFVQHHYHCCCRLSLHDCSLYSLCLSQLGRTMSRLSRQLYCQYYLSDDIQQHNNARIIWL